MEFDPDDRSARSWYFHAKEFIHFSIWMKSFSFFFAQKWIIVKLANTVSESLLSILVTFLEITTE